MGNKRDLVCIDDYEAAAKEALPFGTFSYYSKGDAKREQTLKDSRIAFSRYRLRPCILRGAVANTLSTKVLGHRIDAPFGIAPTAYHGLAHVSKEHGSINAAFKHGVPMIVSSIANLHIDALHREAASGLLWMQTYFFKTSALTKAIIRRAERAGFKALVVTIDSPGLHVAITKEDTSLGSYDYLRWKTDMCARNLDVVVDENREAYMNGTRPNLWDYCIYEVGGSHATEEDIIWLKSFTKLPIILKGVLSDGYRLLVLKQVGMTKVFNLCKDHPVIAKHGSITLPAETAMKAVSLGVDGIIVSAHGGRQLNGVQAPIAVLSEIVQAVHGSGVEVYMDGGVRTGTDILKALALGARAVFIGRPILYGLAVNGQQGVEQVLQLFKDELELAMRLAGVSDVNHIPATTVIEEASYLAAKL